MNRQKAITVEACVVDSTEATNIGHRGAYVSCAQGEAADFKRFKKLAHSIGKRGYTKPMPWPSK